MPRVIDGNDARMLKLRRYPRFSLKACATGALLRLLERDVSAELDRQYQVRGDAAADREAFFGAENLARIERICGDGMRALGYAV